MGLNHAEGFMSTSGQVAMSTGAVAVATPNIYTRYISIKNEGTETVYLHTDNTKCTVADGAISLGENETYTFEYTNMIGKAVYGATNASTSNVRVCHAVDNLASAEAEV